MAMAIASTFGSACLHLGHAIPDVREHRIRHRTQCGKPGAEDFASVQYDALRSYALPQYINQRAVRRGHRERLADY